MIFMLAREKSFFLASKKSFKLNARKPVYCIFLQLIHKTGVFLCALQTAMVEEVGNGLDFDSIVKGVHGKAVAGKMPIDMLVNASSFHLSLNRLAAIFIRREFKERAVQLHEGNAFSPTVDVLKNHL